MDIIIVILFSYLSGSIPFGLILTRFLEIRILEILAQEILELQMYLELVINS